MLLCSNPPRRIKPNHDKISDLDLPRSPIAKSNTSPSFSVSSDPIVVPFPQSSKETEFRRKAEFMRFVRPLIRRLPGLLGEFDLALLTGDSGRGPGAGELERDEGIVV